MPLERLGPASDIPTGDPEHMTMGPEPVAPGQSLQTIPKRKKQKLQLERIGPGGPTFVNPNAPTQKTIGTVQGEDVDVDEAVNMARDTLNWLNARIMPRLGELGQGGEQGLAYAVPNIAANFPKKWQLDPDVDVFFTKLGPLANKINKVYATGGRPSAMGYKTYTKPHIPTPPEKGVMGAYDALLGANFRQYQEQLQTAIDSMGKITGRVPAQTYQEAKPESVPDDNLVPLATPGLYWDRKAKRVVRKVGP